MEGLEKKLSGSKLSSGERKTALVRRARLLELSGNFESAAAAWKEAALAGDTGALLREARCFAAVGEFEKAQEELRTGSRDSPEARLLFSQLEALRTGRTGALGTLLTDPEFSSYKPGIYYSIWKISGDLSARNRLIGEFPQSPEARIAKDAGLGGNAAVNGGSATGALPVGAAPSALWLLMGVRPQSELSGGSAPVAASPQTASAQTTPVVPPPAQAVPASRGPVVSGGPSILQTGLFGREENARTMAERLREAGFTPVIVRKTVNGREHWAVGVAPGADSSRTMLLLKDRGFESFPVYQE
ncbi:MAG: SPOR domain-containing protein [Treponema sp.]|jgi:hypothetical protein|nr:SPOR domain-containing protein [Treponema sp.]